VVRKTTWTAVVVAQLLDGLGAEQAGHVDIAQDEIEDLAPVDFCQHVGRIVERIDAHVFHVLELHELAGELFGAKAVALVVVADGNFDHPSSFHETFVFATPSYELYNSRVSHRERSSS